jgi:hypothetical protein
VLGTRGARALYSWGSMPGAGETVGPARPRARGRRRQGRGVSTRPIVPAEQEHGRGGVVGLVLFSPVVVGKWLLPE